MPSEKSLSSQITILLQEAKNTAAATEALTTLFPKSLDLLGMSKSEDNSEMENRAVKRRISKSEFAHAYFRLTPDKSLWSKSQIAALMGAEPNSVFQNYADRVAGVTTKQETALRIVFIDILSAIIGRKPNDLLEWFLALLDNAGLMLVNGNPQHVELFDLAVEDQLRILLLNALKPLDLAERAQYFEYAIEKARDLSLLCDLFRTVAGDVDAEGATGRLEYGLGDATDDLRTKLLDRVRDIAALGSIGSQALPENLIWFWWGSGFGAEVREYTAQASKTPAGLRLLLRLPINHVRSTAGNFERVDRRAWDKVVDLEELKHAALLLREGGSEDQAIAKRFLDALERSDKRHTP